jgi:hypothetical protein
VEVLFHAFLTSILDGIEWSDSRPGRFTPFEKSPGTHWIGDWVGHRVGLGAVVRRENPISCCESNLGRPARSLVTILTELPRFLIKVTWEPI